MKQERILLEQNDQAYQSMIGELSGYRSSLEDLKVAYEKLQIGDFSEVILKEVISSGSHDIELRFEQEISSQIKRMGITNDVIKDNLTRGNKELFEEFKDASKKVQGLFPHPNGEYPPFHLPLDCISFSDGEFFISPEDQEKLMEKYFRIYLETEEEHRIYNKLKTFLESYTAIEEELKKVKFPFYRQEGGQITGLSTHFLRYKEGKFEIKPGMIRVAIEYHEKQEKFQKEHQDRSSRISGIVNRV